MESELRMSLIEMRLSGIELSVMELTEYVQKIQHIISENTLMKNKLVDITGNLLKDQEVDNFFRGITKTKNAIVEIDKK